MPTRPGRPALQNAQYASTDIVNAACLFFARQGIRGTSNRQIAEAAKVTPALVHYYFKKKENLHRAVLDAAFTPLLAGLRDISTLEEWVSHFHEHLATHPWMPHLIIREVLPPNGELRPFFLKQHAPHIYGSIKAMVTQEAQRRKVRPDFDLDRHVVLLMGMLVYPFLGLEIAQNVTGRKFDRKMMDGFRADALALFVKGMAGK